MGELAVSRAIGDHCLRPYVIPEPEVCMLERSPADEVLILASDGLWDVLSNQEAADMAAHTLHAAEAAGVVGVAAARRAASALTKSALERGTRDNVTCLVVDMRHARAAGAAAAAPAVAAGGGQAQVGGGGGADAAPAATAAPAGSSSKAGSMSRRS
jgi:protein phosphatase 2C